MSVAMNGFDRKVPSSLQLEQVWFGSIIGRPIDDHSHICPYGLSGRKIEEEAAEHVLPNLKLSSSKRIEIYNRQYWWRLLNVLHDAFPLLTRLYGYNRFNQEIAIPYLLKYPPRHWSLNLLGDRLEKWLIEDFSREEKKLTIDVAALDWGFVHSFIADPLSAITNEQLKDEELQILNKKIYAQTHIHLLKFTEDLFSFREACLKHTPDYWQEHPLPKINPTEAKFFVMYRNMRNEISWKEISEPEYFILSSFKEGASLDAICEWLENKEPIYENVSEHLLGWFQEWTSRGWLSTQHPNEIMHECT